MVIYKCFKGANLKVVLGSDLTTVCELLTTPCELKETLATLTNCAYF